VADYREIAYWFGGNRCWATVMGGEVHKSGSQESAVGSQLKPMHKKRGAKMDE
jgi:hypothetical protein